MIAEEGQAKHGKTASPQKELALRIGIIRVGARVATMGTSIKAEVTAAARARAKGRANEGLGEGLLRRARERAVKEKGSQKGVVKDTWIQARGEVFCRRPSTFVELDEI